MQAAEMVAGVSGADGGVLQAQEGLVLISKKGVHVREHLVAELRAVHLSAESS
jgi:hypothetical protein